MNFFTDFKIGSRLGLGFGAIVATLIGVNGYALSSMNRLSSLTTQLYEHPYRVSNAVLNIELGIVMMHRSMKDVALSKDSRQTQAAVNAVNLAEVQVYQNFEVVLSQYLGELSDVTETQQAFQDWKPIRDRVIQLTQAGDREAAAAITRTEGAEYVADLLGDVQEFGDFADGKAASFLEDAEAARQQALRLMFIVSGLSVLAIATLSLALTRSIVTPLQAAMQINSDLAEGDLSCTERIDTTQTRDRPEHRIDEIGHLLLSMKETVTQLRYVVQQTQTISDGIFAGSQTMSLNASHMSQGVSEQAAAIDEASASLDSLNRLSEHSSQQAQTTWELAARVSQDASLSELAVDKALEAMRSILDKIQVVEEIAEQTNVLSLNAGIEAVRAGKSGEGFAVVAAEIRKLAEGTRQAAQEINTLAGSSLNVANDAGKSLKTLVGNVQDTAASIETIRHSSVEQDRATTQIHQAIQQLEDVARDNSNVAADVDRESKKLAEQAQALQQAIAFFQFAQS